MNTRILVALSLLVGIGAVLHAVVPGFFLGMKPDMMLMMMFMGIILFPEKKYVLLLGAVTGLISALTTTFPGGQLPNIIDKLATAFIFYGLFIALKKFRTSMISVAVLTAVCTIISGIVFLCSAYLIVGLPGPFAALFGAVVLPTTAASTIAIVIIYPVAAGIMKRTKFTEQTKSISH
jgi:hypothetical protein